jgi:hypothetical protein
VSSKNHPHLPGAGPETSKSSSNVEVVSPAGLEERIRELCMDLPGVTEKLSHGAPAFFAGRQFLMLWIDGHHDHTFPHLWCAAPPGAQSELVTTEPDRFFRPPYVGGRGWLGVRLDGRIDWKEIEALCEEAFRTVASKKLIASLDLRMG